MVQWMWKASPTALKAALTEEYDLYHVHDPGFCLPPSS